MHQGRLHPAYPTRHAGKASGQAAQFKSALFRQALVIEISPPVLKNGSKSGFRKLRSHFGAHFDQLHSAQVLDQERDFQIVVTAILDTEDGEFKPELGECRNRGAPATVS